MHDNFCMLEFQNLHVYSCILQSSGVSATLGLFKYCEVNGRTVWNFRCVLLYSQMSAFNYKVCPLSGIPLHG